MRLPVTILIVGCLAMALELPAADLLDLFKKKPAEGKSGDALGLLPEEQVIKGLKEALAKGVQHSITNLGREGGYLSQADVKIPMPENLQRVERTLRSLKQDQYADEFIATMNRAAEMAVPEAASIFADSIRNMTLADARSLLHGPDDAATQYFRKTSEIRLEEKMLPIVKKATETAGVTASYKKLTEKAGPAAAVLRFDSKSFDVDTYVTDKAVDGLFKRIAEQEKSIRQNPAARTTDLLKKVFGSATSPGK